MYLLGDPLTTRPIQMAWEFTIKLYRSWRLGFIEDPDGQIANGLIWTWTQTQSDDLESLLTLLLGSDTLMILTPLRVHSTSPQTPLEASSD